MTFEGDRHRHAVQFYGKDAALLVQNVAAFFAEPLKEGGGAVIIASAEHRDAVIQRLENMVAGAAAKIVALDANEKLGQFMAGGQPDPERFARTVGAIVRNMQGQYPHIRAYGEMVGILWERRQLSAAIALEQLWNQLVSTAGFELFCSYPIDICDPEFQIGSIHAVLATHSEVVTGRREQFQTALERALEEVLGPRATGLRLLAGATQSRSWPQMPHAERTVLWLRNNLPHYAEEIVRKAAEY